jgi:hypothetical protein
MEDSFDDFFKVYHIDEEIRSEAQQLFDREMQKICFEVRIDCDEAVVAPNFPKQPFDISHIKVLSIEIFSSALGKWKDRTRGCEDDREPIQCPQYYYREENLFGTTMAVLKLVKILQSAISLTQLSVTFMVEELEDSYGQDDTEERSITTLSMMKTLADPFKALRGINRPRLVGICSLQETWPNKVKVSLLDESDEGFRQYKTGWEETLARLEHLSGLRDVERMYYQLLQNRYDISNATSQLGSVKTAWDWRYARGGGGELIYDDYLADALGVHLNTVNDLLLDAREARDDGNAPELRQIDEKIAQSFQIVVRMGDDLIQGWIEERKQAVEDQCCKRRKLGADSFTV